MRWPGLLIVQYNLPIGSIANTFFSIGTVLQYFFLFLVLVSPMLVLDIGIANSSTNSNIVQIFGTAECWFLCRMFSKATATCDRTLLHLMWIKRLMTILLIQQTHFHLWIAIHNVMCYCPLLPSYAAAEKLFSLEDAFFHPAS